MPPGTTIGFFLESVGMLEKDLSYFFNENPSSNADIQTRTPCYLPIQVVSDMDWDIKMDAKIYESINIIHYGIYFTRPN